MSDGEDEADLTSVGEDTVSEREDASLLEGELLSVDDDDCVLDAILLAGVADSVDDD